MINLENIACYLYAALRTHRNATYHLTSKQVCLRHSKGQRYAFTYTCCSQSHLLRTHFTFQCVWCKNQCKINYTTIYELCSYHHKISQFKSGTTCKQLTYGQEGITIFKQHNPLFSESTNCSYVKIIEIRYYNCTQ